MWHYLLNFLIIFSIVGSIYDLITIKALFYVEKEKHPPTHLITYNKNLCYRTKLYLLTFFVISIINWKLIPLLWGPILLALIPKCEFLRKNNFIFFCFYTVLSNILFIYTFISTFYKFNS